MGEGAFRDQGMYVLSKLLDMDVITPSRLGVDNMSGYVSAMDAAKGAQGGHYILTLPEDLAEAQQKQRQIADSYKDAGLPAPPCSSMPLIDASDPSLQVASIKLAALDYIGGHFDRHAGNFFVSKDENGRYKITGIDNDSAFPSKNTRVRLPEPEEAVRVVTPEIRQQILDMDEDRVVNALKGVVDRTAMGAEALDAVRERIGKLKKHVGKMVPVPEDRLGAETARTMMAPGNNPLREITIKTGDLFKSADRSLDIALKRKERAAKQPEKEKASAEKSQNEKKEPIDKTKKK